MPTGHEKNIQNAIIKLVTIRLRQMNKLLARIVEEVRSRVQRLVNVNDFNVCLIWLYLETKVVSFVH